MPGQTRRLTGGDGEPFEYGGVGHDPKEIGKGAGGNAKDVGVSTRHAVRGDGSEEGEIDVPRVQPGRPTFPTGTQRAEDDAPTDVVDFEPREGTPPSMTPDT